MLEGHSVLINLIPFTDVTFMRKKCWVSIIKYEVSSIDQVAIYWFPSINQLLSANYASRSENNMSWSIPTLTRRRISEDPDLPISRS